MKKILSSFMVFILFFGTVGSFQVDAISLPDSSNHSLTEEQVEKMDEKIHQFLQTETVSEQVFENMSDAEQDVYIENMLNSEEYIQLERELRQIEDSVATFALPLLLAPVTAYVARVALKTIADKGSVFAKKYIKGKLDNIGDNYQVLWTQPNSLVVVLQGSGKNKKRVFAIDNATIPLNPGSTKKIWHYHITPDVGMHNTICSFIPKGHKPDTKTKCY